MLNTNCRPDVNSRVIIKSNNPPPLNTEDYLQTSNRRTGKKRLFSEMLNSHSNYQLTWEDSEAKIDKTIFNLSTLSITKKFKLNSSNKTFSQTHEIPTEQYFNTSYEKNNKPNLREEFLEGIQSEPLPKIFNMEREKEMVENYYREKNKFLMFQMFGEKAL
jgi:hypothetical protein